MSRRRRRQRLRIAWSRREVRAEAWSGLGWGDRARSKRGLAKGPPQVGQTEPRTAAEEVDHAARNEDDDHDEEHAEDDLRDDGPRRFRHEWDVGRYRQTAAEKLNQQLQQD